MAVSGAVVASAPDMPVMYARYPGTSGRQHGDRNVTAPAAAATGIASSSGPDDTRLTTDMPPSMADAGRRGWPGPGTGLVVRPGGRPRHVLSPDMFNSCE